MRICYIGHSYHRKTASTNFMADCLEARSDHFVRHDILPDPETVAAFDLDALAAENFDLICVFQIEFLAQRIADAQMNARLVFIPMYDGCRMLGQGYWASFANRPDIRVVNFSSTLHHQLMGWGVDSYRFQFFPDPAKMPGSADADAPSKAFFWQRTDRPSWGAVKTLLGSKPDLAVHLHLAGDPSLKAAVDTEAERAERDITVSTWFEDAGGYKEAVAACDIYVSPREFEGIGMSFLEAMAAGKCVIAPDNPTMNEYIIHGVNGLLYSIDAPQELDLSTTRAIGDAARIYAANGHRIWAADFATRMQDVLFAPTLDASDAYREVGTYVWHKGADAVPALSSALSTDHATLPRVSVAVVCYNSEDELAPTLDSIVAQTYGNMEIVVVDGQSTDGTPEILYEYRDHLDVSVSEADKGVYDAMNKATKLASGDYIVFMNAGDFFHLPTSLEEMMTATFGPGGRWTDQDTLPDFVIGNHIYIDTDGGTNLHKTEDFDRTWSQLQTGKMPPHWWGGIPCHQATLARRARLAEIEYDLSFKITADHNYMFTSRAAGASFVHSGTTTAIYMGGGMSQQRGEECIRESYRVSRSTTSAKDELREFYVRTFGLYSVIENPEKLRADTALLRQSGMFNEEWYALRYMTREAQFTDPIEHYLAKGHLTNCMPNPFFDGEHYLLRNTDVFEAGMNPFVHYVAFGAKSYRPTYDWDSPEAPMSSLKQLFSWQDHSVADIEARLAVASPAEIWAGLRDLP